MAIRRRCRGTCRSARRCLEHLWFDVKHRNTRYRVPVNDFAVPRMEPNKQRPVQSMEEVRLGAAVRRRDQGRARSAAQAGPQRGRRRISRALQASSTRTSNVTCDRLAYAVSRRRPDESRSGSDTSATSRSRRWKSRRSLIGSRPKSEYSGRVEISTLHKVLAILRAAIRWGQAQTPPLIDKSPFQRFGVRLNTKAETVRDRRISREEEKGLLDAALAMNTWEHKYVGPLMHDRIIGALELCCRLGEMLVIQNKRVDWDTHTIGIPVQTTKDKENRRIPFDPNGRLAAVLSRRGKLGPNAFVFGTENGE